MNQNIETIGCQSYGIFWDIENCRIPSLERVSNVIQNIKKFIATKYLSRVGDHSEPCTFMCSCDTKVLDKTHVEALNRCGVDILHVNPIRALNGTYNPGPGMAFKVNADFKLIENIHKFVEHHFNTKKCLLFVITGDIDFAPAIRTAKRKGFEVILLYGTNTSMELKNCATEAHSYNEVVDPIKCMFSDAPNATPPAPPLTGAASLCDIALPKEISVAQLNKALLDRPPSATPSSRTRTEPLPSPLPAFVEQAQNNVRRFNVNVNENHCRPKTGQQDVELNPEFINTIQEVAQVERHIAIRMLQTTRGDLSMAINLLIND